LRYKNAMKNKNVMKNKKATRNVVLILMSRALASCFLLQSSAMAAEFKPPFATRLPDSKAAQRACPALSAPVINFNLPSKYGAAKPSAAIGNRRDKVDEDAESDFEEAMAPIKDFMSDVVKAANDYQRTGRISAANCALNHLVHWAQSGALKEPETHTSWFKLATTTAGLSFALMQIEPALGARHADVKLVSNWLGAHGKAISTYFDGLKMPRASRNNHRAWAGLAVASAGTLTHDARLVNWGAESLRLVVCQATAEGALPLEIERGAKAREYHFYALAALMPLAEIIARSGQNPFEICADALHRIAGFTVRAVAQPSAIEALAGARQAGNGKPPSASRLVFLEPYLARFPGKLPEANTLLKQRPLGSTDLGGNQTLLYAR
jgi:poly(beta-D-mannuronate) lyase